MNNFSTKDKLIAGLKTIGFILLFFVILIGPIVLFSNIMDMAWAGVVSLIISGVSINALVYFTWPTVFKDAIDHYENKKIERCE